MIPLTDEEKRALQGVSWRKWCLDLIDRRFHDTDPITDKSFAVLAFDEYPYAVVLHDKMFFIKCILSEGYGK